MYIVSPFSKSHCMCLSGICGVNRTGGRVRTYLHISMAKDKVHFPRLRCLAGVA